MSPLATLLLLLLGAAAPPAVHDPRDAVGFPLDVRAAWASSTPEAATFTLQTYEPFGNDLLGRADGDDYAVAIGIGTDADESFERLCYVHVRPAGDGFEPFAVVTAGMRLPEADFNPFSIRARPVGYGEVRRPTAYTVEVTVPARLLGPASPSFRWRARMVSSPESGTVHYDYVPDDRLVRNRRRGPPLQ